jgi:enhancing lycopene biosynthesis protein 2
LTTKKRFGPGKGEKESLIMFTHPGIHCAVNVESRYYKLAWESAGAKAGFVVISDLLTDRKGAYPLCAYCGNVVDTVEMKNLVGSAEKKANPPSLLPICTTCKDVKNLPARKANEKFSLAEELVDVVE